ncbi:MAG: DNA polymerase III subunit delta [Vampirovibrionales bacterium]
MPFYFIITEDPYWQQRYLATLHTELNLPSPSNSLITSLDNPSTAELESYCGTQSLFSLLDSLSQPDLTRLRHWQALQKLPSQKEQDDILSILGHLPSNKHLICMTEKLDQRSTFSKKLIGLATKVYVPEEPPHWKEDAWIELIRKEVAQSCKCNLTPPIARWLFQHIGPHLGEIIQRTQTAQLLIEPHDSTLTLKHVEALIPRSYYQGFELLDTWIEHMVPSRSNMPHSKRMEEHWSILWQYVHQEPALKLIALLKTKLLDLHTLIDQKAQGHSEEAIAQALGKHPFILKKTYQRFKSITLTDIARTLKHLTLIEWQIKEGILPPALGIELFLAHPSKTLTMPSAEAIHSWEMQRFYLTTDVFEQA